MKTGQDLDEAISEHQHLIKVLRSTSHEDDRREAKKQAAELKTLRRKKVRDGLPAKPAPEAYPGVEPGDSLYIHHPKRGPLAVKVHAQGRHGVTATDSEGNWHRAQWQHVLGAKQRLSQRLTMVEQGEDGAIVEDEQGQRRYIAIDPEARPDPEPLRKSQPIATQAQIEAGNYRKEHLRFQGLDISIENPKGSVRTGTDPGGKTWRVTMHHAYGYIRGTCGVDKDHVDCYLGPNPDASHAYVVHQRQAGKWDRYDEDKVMLGFDSAEDAKAAYLAQYDDPRFFGTMTALPMADFKRKALATRQRPRMIKGQVLFFKAVKTKSAHQGSLFDQVDPVKGYTRKDGVFVPPHQAKHKHALKPAPAQKPDSTLSDDEKSAVSRYSQSGYNYSYAYINNYLRNDTIDKRHNKAEFDQVVSRIDSGIAKSRTTAPVLYRGSSLVEYGLDRTAINSTLIGKVLADKAYTSTSLSKDVVTDAYVGRIGAILEITPQPDAPALELGDLAAIKSEQEVLLPRNAQLLITAISTTKDGTPIIHADYVRPIQKALILFLKADVKGHIRRLANGKIVTVKPYRDKRGHQADKHSGELFGETPARPHVVRPSPAPTPAPAPRPDPEPTPAPKPRKLTQIEKLRARMADLFATVPDPEPIPVKTHFENARNRVLAHGRATGNELAVLVDGRTGETLESKEGTNKAVYFTDSMMALLSDPAQSVRIFHNHPSSSSLSLADLLICTHPGAESIEAVGHDGSRYRSKPLIKDQVLLEKVIESANSAVKDKFQLLYNSGQLTIDQVQTKVQTNHWHAVNKALAHANIIEYEFLLSSERNDSINSLGALFAMAINHAAKKAKFRLALGQSHAQQS